MSAQEQMINSYLQNLGVPGQLQALPANPTLKLVAISYSSVNMAVILVQDAVLFLEAGLGYAPKQTLLPFYRRILVANSNLINASFCLKENDNNVVIRSSRQVIGLDFQEFKAMVDAVVLAVHQQAAPIARDFPFQATP